MEGLGIASTLRPKNFVCKQFGLTGEASRGLRRSTVSNSVASAFQILKEFDVIVEETRPNARCAPHKPVKEVVPLENVSGDQIGSANTRRVDSVAQDLGTQLANMVDAAKDCVRFYLKRQEEVEELLQVIILGGSKRKVPGRALVKFWCTFDRGVENLNGLRFGERPRYG